MDFEQYQDLAADTAIYPKKDGLAYTTLGLVGEAGEIANKIKKVIRDHDGFVQPSTREDLEAELGDILWYVAMLSTTLGLNLEDGVQLHNKLFDNRITYRA